MLHISVSKSVHICTFATLTVHIYTVTVDLVSNILDFFLSPSPHSLSFSLSPLSRSISVPLLVSIALRSFSSILDPFLQSDILTSQNDATGATSFAYNAQKLKSSSRLLKKFQPLRRSNILHHCPHPLHRLPPRPRQNCRACHPNHQPHGLLHPRFPHLQTRRLLWWFWWFLGFWWFLFFVWSVGEGRVWWWCLMIWVLISGWWWCTVCNGCAWWWWIDCWWCRLCVWEDFKRREKCEGWRK